MQTLPLFKTQCVRDLAWSCFGNNLIDDFSHLKNSQTINSLQIELTKTRQNWLLQLDDNPTSLQQHLLKLKSPRLGIYFEALWQFFLQQDDEYELVAHNLPVYKNKKTLGEFDIIYRDTGSDDYYHLELAIKYYLNYSTTNIAENKVFSADYQYWLGPNAVDRLDIKTAHLLNHQSQLSKTAEGKELLLAKNINQIKQQIAIKGSLFYPYVHGPAVNNNRTEDQAEAQTDGQLSPTHSFSHWIKHSEFQSISNRWHYWYRLEKSFWISPAYDQAEKLAPNIINKTSINQYLQDYFSSNKQALMLCAMTKQGNYLLEEKRFFITADDWPTSTR